MEKKLKLQRLRDITLYHLQKHEGTEIGKTTIGQLAELEYDIKVWIKNFLLTLEELDSKAEVTNIGEDNEYGRDD